MALTALLLHRTSPSGSTPRIPVLDRLSTAVWKASLAPRILRCSETKSLTLLSRILNTLSCRKVEFSAK